MKQVNDVSRSVGATGEVAGPASFSPRRLRRAFAVYASVINNGTDDPRILSPR